MTIVRMKPTQATSEKPSVVAKAPETKMVVKASEKPDDEFSDLRGKLKELTAQREGLQKKCNEQEKLIQKQQAIIDALDEKFANFDKVQEEAAVLADAHTEKLEKRCERWHKLYQHYLAKYEDTIVG